MRKFWRFFLVAMTGLILMLLSPPITGHAQEVQSTGTAANNAVIKDARGKVYDHNVQLPPGNYVVNYNWTIPNSAKVNAGDTMTFYLPSNIYIPADDDFIAYAQTGAKTGTVHFGKGESFGVFTLNSYYKTHNLNRHGWMKVDVPVPAKPVEPITMSKNATWVNPEKPSVINWQLTVHHTTSSLANPVVKDTFSNNQKYVPGSVRATTATGQNIPVTASGSLLGNSMTFKLSGTYDTDITLTYQTQSKLPTGADTFTNNANYTDDGGHQASANASINREAEPSNPGPGEPGQKEPIAMSKAVSWADPHDQTKLNWTINIEARNNPLVNPKIVDQLSANQTYVPASASLAKADGQKIPFAVSASPDGRTITFRASGTFTTDLRLTYQSKVASTRGQEYFTNNATYSDDGDNRATATAVIDRTVEPALPPISMTKRVAWTDPENQFELNWKLKVASNGRQLVNPTIVDQMSPNQSYVIKSEFAKTSTGQSIPVSTLIRGRTVIFKLTGTYTTNIQLQYQSTTIDRYTAETFDNVAVYEDEAGNQASANASIDREATEEPSAPEPVTMAKTATWVDPTDKTKINWELAIAADGNNLVNPVITDQLSNNHTYVAGSVRASSAQGNIPVAETVNGSQVKFRLAGNFDTDLKITYQTTTNKPTGAETFTNAAVFTDDNQNEAEASSSIDREALPVEPAKDPITLTKVATWADPNDQTKINWQLKIAANGNTLKNPVVTDVLSNNQTYLVDSVTAVDAAGNTIPVATTVNGQTITFKFSGELTGDLTLTYQTTTNQATSHATFDNAAIVDDDNGNHAGGGSSINRETPPAKDPIGMQKLAAWQDPNDQTKINWTIAISANGNVLANPVITDILSNNQTYIANSATAIDDSGQELPLTADLDGNTVTFKLAGTFTRNFKLTYQTRTRTASGAEVFDNAAIYTDDNDNNGSASTNIDRKVNVTEPEEPGEPSQPGTTEPTNPGTKPTVPGPTKPQVPGPTNPVKPGTPAPTKPQVPGPTNPAKPSAPAPTKPQVPTQPAESGSAAVNSNRSLTPAPNPYNPTPGRLPQTDEHHNSMLDTVLGCLALLFGLGFGYLDLRHHNL